MCKMKMLEDLVCDKGLLFAMVPSMSSHIIAGMNNLPQASFIRALLP